MIKIETYIQFIYPVFILFILCNCTAYYGVQGKRNVKEIKGKYHILEKSATSTSEILIYGCVVDRKSKEPVLNARIFVPGMLDVTTRSDSSGGFKLKIPPGIHQIQAEASAHNFVRIPERNYVKGEKVKVLFELGKSIKMEKWRYR